MKLQLNFQIVRFLNYKQRFSDSLPPSPSENVSWMHIIEGRTAIATPLKPI